MKEVCVSSFGLRILQKMDPGNNARLLPNGGLRVGSIEAPPSLVKDLARRDFITFPANGRVALSEAGAMYLRRTKTARKFARSGKLQSGGNIYRAQHSCLRTEQIRAGQKREKMTRNIGETPLGWLLRRKDRDGKPYITEDQFNAGERLAADYEYAGLMPRTVSYYDGVPVSGKKYYSSVRDDPSLTQMAAKQRVNAALDSIGPGLADVLIRVCCFHEGLEQAEKNLAWPTRSAKLVLKIALERLADYYQPGKK